jgi:hypothetical protein
MTQTLPCYTISLLYDEHTMRWRQENQSTGKAIQLQYPWEINAATMKMDKRFDDWWDAMENFNPLRARKRI